ncbi:MAG: hypothetical protein KC492_07205 [Myxococcales bacterium]|nr:hypothetical protein [Myxococcales bacterium]
MNRHRAPGSALVLLGVALGVSSCQGSYEMERDEPCRQAGFAIASRNQACNGDADHANALYERFVDEYLCSVTKPSQNAFRCAYNINALGCEEVAAKGDDLNGYLSANGCGVILKRKDGTPIPQAGGGVTATPLCASLVLRLAEFESACGDNEPPGDLSLLIASDLTTDHECAANATPAELATCLSALDGKRCIDFSIARELLDATPSCDSVLPAQEVAP